MPIFVNDVPSRQRIVPPDFAEDVKTRRKLGALGFKHDGTRNVWGKVSRVLLPGSGLLTNRAARGVARRGGASDSMANIDENLNNEFGILGTAAGIGLAAAGGVTSNPALVSAGLGLTADSVGKLATDQEEYHSSVGSIYVDG